MGGRSLNQFRGSCPAMYWSSLVIEFRRVWVRKVRLSEFVLWSYLWLSRECWSCEFLCCLYVGLVGLQTCVACIWRRICSYMVVEWSLDVIRCKSTCASSSKIFPSPYKVFFGFVGNGKFLSRFREVWMYWHLPIHLVHKYFWLD